MANDTTYWISRIMARHPNGVTARQLVGALVGPDCKHSEAQRAVQNALDRGDIILGAGMRLYAPVGKSA